MTDLLKLIFDAYSRQARLYPALLTLVPPLTLIAALWPDLLTLTSLPGLVGFTAAFGVLYALASFARSRGKQVEKRLLKVWGAWPTTIWLRHRSMFVQKPTLARYHQFLADHVPDWVRPLEADEQADIEKADSYYASAVDWLKEQCRGPDFPMVEKENTEYGYRRNLRGIRNVGVSVCIGGIIAALGMLEYRYGGSESVSAFIQPRHLWALLSSATGAAIVFNLFAVAAWLTTVNDDWVREAADQYARALLANCDDSRTIAAMLVKQGTVATQP